MRRSIGFAVRTRLQALGINSADVFGGPWIVGDDIGPIVNRYASFTGAVASARPMICRKQEEIMRRIPHRIPSLSAGSAVGSESPPAQAISTPPSGDNQQSSVTQHIGLVEVTIDYSSPDVHAPDGDDRRGKIWGTLVPYGRAGRSVRHVHGMSVARRREREHGLHGLARREDRRSAAGRRQLRAASWSRAPDEWTVIFSKNARLVGQLLLRREGRRAAREGEAVEGGVQRVAHVRVHRPQAGQGHGGAEVGRAAGADHDHGRQRHRPAHGAHPQRAAQLPGLQLAELGRRRAVRAAGQAPRTTRSSSRTPP